MLKGFKDFILRGNVVELSVAVIIGSAFTAIVTAITKNLIQPLINVFGSAEVAGFGPQLTDNPSTFMDFGAVITAILNFLIIAAVVYFGIITPINKLNDAAKRRMGIDPKASTPTSEELLAEIRDLLEAQSGKDADTAAELGDSRATSDRLETPATAQPQEVEKTGRHRA